MQKLWKIKERLHTDLITHLLASKNLSSPEEIDEFLNSDYAKLNSPFLFAEMQKAVDRIWQAIINKEKILIYSDYDADAITSNAVLFRMFQFLGVGADTYIPDRFTEGYGLNLQAFEKIKALGADLVITVDCGTNSVNEAEFCAVNGIDLIITDHHEITGDIPNAFALLNPKRPDESYPYKQLTGVGVAFKLATAIFLEREKHDWPEANLPDGYEKWLLDLVAIGTVADCHSLLGENRILVKFGLGVLAKTRWQGLRAMISLAGLWEKAKTGSLDTYSIGFVIAPRINAAGRIDHAQGAFDLLVCDDPIKALSLAENLEKLNQHRQALTQTVMSEARLQIAAIESRKVLLAVGNDWPKGVVGLVAGKLCEEYAKPVLVLERGEFEATGSARSIPSFNIVNALNFSKDILVKYGGHAGAAGFTVKTEHIEVLYKNLLDFAEKNLDDQSLVKVIEIDAEARPEEVSLETADTIERFQPFGIDNYKPKLMLSNLEIKDMAIVGKDQKHLQMTLVFNSGQGGQVGTPKIFKCIGFNFARSAQVLTVGDKIDVVFELLADGWNGRKTVKLKIIDFRKAAADAGI